jgi:hypothetical protein
MTRGKQNADAALNVSLRLATLISTCLSALAAEILLSIISACLLPSLAT